VDKRESQKERWARAGEAVVRHSPAIKLDFVRNENALIFILIGLLFSLLAMTLPRGANENDLRLRSLP